MTIAIDDSPLVDFKLLQHRVRGTGFYIENLKKSLLKYHPSHKYIFFNRNQKVPEADIIHYPYFEPFFLTLPFKKKARRIVTVHDLTPLVFPEAFPVGVRGYVKWQIQKMALKNSDAIIADSICSKNDIVKYTGIDESKIHVVYLAPGEEFTSTKISEEEKKSLKNKYNLPDKFVLYVGDVTWNKNLPRLIEAVKKINVPLVMVGNALVDKRIDMNNFWNKDVVKVQKLAQDNKNIILLGFVQTQDLVGLYKTATVFAMPSLYEGFGLPVLEAMQCGRPVVTTKEGSIQEVAADAATYVDPYDVNSIAEGVLKVFSSKNLQEDMKKKGTESAREFSWHKTARETLGVYKKTI